MAGNLKTVWNLEKESAFIDFVSERAALWNPLHTNYAKKTLRQALYDEIRNEMIMRWPEDATILTGGVLRKKFNTLRSYFQREERKLKLASGSAGLELAPKWVHFQRMLFLKDTAIVGQSESNLDVSTLETMGELEESNLTISDSQQETDDCEDIIPQPGTSFEHEPSCKTPKPIPARYYDGCPPRKRRKLANTGEDVIKTVTSALKARSDQENSMAFHIGKLVENAMRKLFPPSCKRVYAKNIQCCY
ncbi:hypothetical protein AVEN_256172-1 [Araneus ventricosus]|uniref:MADF domain-containing protein n=1 Tax=Araneus ventricosus TaxID=182803 RepID=A0A4Y2I364_ARAVE|nr:hypothetical protein AVEN_256172-1 [Araneus ventricosus]